MTFANFKNIFSPFHLKLAPSCFFSLCQRLKGPHFFLCVCALESHCTSAKRHSCLPQNKNCRKISGHRIKGRGGFVWQIVAGVLPVCLRLKVAPSHCQLENYRS